MTRPSPEQLAASVDPILRAYIDGCIEMAVAPLVERIAQLEIAMAQAKAQQTVAASRQDARIADLEKVLSLDIPSKRRLLELIDAVQVTASTQIKPE